MKETKFPVALFISGHASGSTTMESTASHLTSAQLAFGLIIRNAPSDQMFEIPDSTRGKMVTIMTTGMSATDSMFIGDERSIDGTITHTGWSVITFDDPTDIVTLLWLDDTSGWIITANGGCTITQ